MSLKLYKTTLNHSFEQFQRFVPTFWHIFKNCQNFENPKNRDFQHIPRQVIFISQDSAGAIMKL
jgi:hypothetical protein